MDGSFRWALSHGQGVARGHEAGIGPLRALIQCCCDWGVPALTVYAFSSENWQRSGLEVSFLMSLFEGTLQSELPEMQRRGVRLLVAGERAALPPKLRSEVDRTEQATAGNTSLVLTIALSYGGRQDIVAAARRLAESVQSGSLQPEQITEQLFESCLSTRVAVEAAGSPDLLIRTSGEQRLSNFLLWELAYAELYFVPVLWPDFGEPHFAEALREFAHRRRRYGKR